ncbi:hypothetical protein [Clostridium perfringens]|nr:hypothetical protein [Clostridium perfringens]
MKAKVIIRQKEELLKDQVDLLNVYFGTNELSTDEIIFTAQGSWKLVEI